MNIQTLFIAFVILFSSCACEKNKPENPDNPDNGSDKKTTLTLLDKNATEKTKALYANLWKLRNVGTVFGHHESLLYGKNWNNETNRSDIKDVTGDFPGVCSLDFSKIENDASNGINGSSFADIRRVTKEAFARGEIISYCWHADNPLTNGDSWDNSSNIVAKEILTEGSATNIKFKTWLDRLATFTKTLTDDNGELIPIIFRPFHEHNQKWSWWSAQCTTEDEFINLWKFTVDYLKNEKGLHNFIYSISPQMDFADLTQEDYLSRWPGDDYVDFLGMDCYHGTGASVFSSNIYIGTQLSKTKNKPFGITETGDEGILKNGTTYTNFWTIESLAPLQDKKASLIIYWRNKYDPTGTSNHFYAPYKGHGSVSNFLTYYNNPSILFSSDLPKMYTMPENYEVN